MSSETLKPKFKKVFNGTINTINLQPTIKPRIGTTESTLNHTMTRNIPEMEIYPSGYMVKHTFEHKFEPSAEPISGTYNRRKYSFDSSTGGLALLQPKTTFAEDALGLNESNAMADGANNVTSTHIPKVTDDWSRTALYKNTKLTSPCNRLNRKKARKCFCIDETDSIDNSNADASDWEEALREKVRHELRTICLFGSHAALDPEEIEMCFASMKQNVFDFSAGELVIREGDDGDAMYVIVKGSLQATTMDIATNMTKVLTKYDGRGAFGELALLYNCKRNATVSALTDCQLLCLTRAAYQQVLRNITQRHLLEAFHAIEQVPEFQSLSKSQKHKIAGAMKPMTFQKEQVVFDTTKRKGNKRSLFNSFQPDYHADVDHSPYDCLFIVGSGTGDAFESSNSFTRTFGSANNTSESKEPKHLKVGDTFGDSALMEEYNHMFETLAQRSLSKKVVATSDHLTCFALDKRHFGTILGPLRDIMRTNFLMDVLSNIPFLHRLHLNQEELQDLTLKVQSLHFATGEVVAKQGDPGGKLYIVSKGLVQFLQEPTKQSVVQSLDAKREVGRLTVGDHFGESTLIDSKSVLGGSNSVSDFPVTCVALIPTHLYTIDLKNESLDLLKRFLLTSLSIGNNPVLQRQSETANQSIAQRDTRTSPQLKKGNEYEWSLESPSVGLNHSRNHTSTNKSHWRTHDHGLVFSIHDLEPITVLGRGAFGTVVLVRHKISDIVYALKHMKKSKIVRCHQESHVHNERNLMETLSRGTNRHPFIANLIRTFKDQNAVYLLMEAALCGDLFSCLSTRTYLSLTEVEFIVAQFVLAVEHLHSHGILYRDLKPENAVLCTDGYLKLTDFGLAKEVGETRTFTFCGTPAFLAPEVFRMRGHGKEIDCWAIGIIIYELLIGEMPFSGDNVRNLGLEMQEYEEKCNQCIELNNQTCPTNFDYEISRKKRNYHDQGRDQLSTLPNHRVFHRLEEVGATPECLDFVFQCLNPDSVRRISVFEDSCESKTRKHPFFKRIDWSLLLRKEIQPPKELMDTLNKYPLKRTIYLQAGKGDEDSRVGGNVQQHFHNLPRSQSDLETPHKVPLIGIPAESWDSNF